jgi:hypothetical protein
MIEEALSFTQRALNQFLMNRFDTQSKSVVINNVVDDDNAVPLVNQNKMVLSLINIESETSKPFTNRNHNLNNGYYTNINPPERFNLDLLVTANYQDYLEALKFLNSTILFFQIFSSVDVKSFSFFPSALEKLEFELVKMNFDKMFNLWSAMGAKYKPSMVYKIRLVTIQGGDLIAFKDAITQTSENVYPDA